MKKIIFVIGFIFAMMYSFSLQTSYASNSSVNTEIMYSTPTSNKQCAAITKSGARCKRMAQVGSKYCWQHNK